MKRLGNHGSKPADKPENWPASLTDDIPRLQRVILPLRDFVAAGCTGTHHVGGQSLDSWRLRRRLDRDGAAS